MDAKGWRYAVGIVLLVLLYLVARPHIGDEYQAAIIAVPTPLGIGEVPTPFPAQTPPTTLPGAFPSLLECLRVVRGYPAIVSTPVNPYAPGATAALVPAYPAPGRKMYAMRCERHYALLWGWDR